MSDVGKLIRKLRGKMSLREASQKIGISHTYLDTIEKGHDKRSGKPVNPSPETLRMIAEAYDYPYVKLLRNAGYIDDIDQQEDEDFANFISDPSLRRWYKELPKSSEEDLQRLKRIYEAFKDD